ncbi:toll-like receptor 2 [Monodelphis domestica]|uniref:Toll-like receptor 2 n=1 Tax=Monodelphis domestica TaxID=13616 RepID=F6UTM1_MONDO|nr:toll-like receptor 2 [Monodelphis domestica]
MRQIRWSVWILCTIINFSEEDAPKQTSLSCDPAGGVCDGHSRSLDTIPSDLTEAVRQLDLSFNKISHIRELDLRNCVNLEALLLQSNRIRSIDPDSFQFLRNLKHLDLSSNSLSYLSPSWFNSLSSLRVLYLHKNPYQRLGQSPLFSHLPSLRVLKVGSYDRFSELQKQDFEGLRELEDLEIEAAYFQKYEPGSLKSIHKINHLALSIRKPNLLPDILVDLASSLQYLEFRKTNLGEFNFSMPPNTPSPLIEKIILREVIVTDKSFIDILKMFSYASELLEIVLEDCILNGLGLWEEDFISEIHHEVKVETIIIRRLRIGNFFLFRDLSPVYSLLQGIKRITLTSSKVFLVPCDLSKSLKSLEYFDLSDSLMSEGALENSACEGAWPSLHTLNLSQNKFESLKTMGELLLTVKNLTHLDISKNNLDSMPDSCQWPGKLKYLNISSTKTYTVTSCIPQTLEILDISNNQLSDFNLNLPHLKELYLSKNKLKTLPDAAHFPHLVVMNISQNTLYTFSKAQLESFQTTEILAAGGNNFICSCEFLSFVHHEQTLLVKVLTDWPGGYLCDAPFQVRGQRVQDVQLSFSECYRVELVAAICSSLFLLALLAGVLCYQFHGIWYMKMMWAWLQAKRKPRRNPDREICYDAFVSYSEGDSHWVENFMVQELENFDPPFRLCLHKRDFVPGKWIIDNIIDSIDKSHKTLFVLSESFVKSEWCKYELDFSHFRLFDENNDTAILILLEPIEKKTIPQRFCKLRKIMNTKTYLEWPRDEGLQEEFWFNLRAAIKS